MTLFCDVSQSLFVFHLRFLAPLAAFVTGPTVMADTYPVTNTNDSGAGSIVTGLVIAGSSVAGMTVRTPDPGI